MAGVVVIGGNTDFQILIDNKLKRNVPPNNYKQQNHQHYYHQHQQQQRKCNDYNEMAISIERYNTSAVSSAGSLSSSSSLSPSTATSANDKYNNEINKNDNNRPQNFLYNCNKSSTSSSSSTVTVPLCLLGDVQLRFLCPEDLEEVRALCQDWFPIGKFIYYVNLILIPRHCFQHPSTWNMGH